LELEVFIYDNIVYLREYLRECQKCTTGIRKPKRLLIGVWLRSMALRCDGSLMDYVITQILFIIVFFNLFTWAKFQYSGTFHLKFLMTSSYWNKFPSLSVFVVDNWAKLKWKCFRFQNDTKCLLFLANINIFFSW